MKSRKLLKMYVRIKRKRHAILFAGVTMLLFTVYQNCGKQSTRVDKNNQSQVAAQASSELTANQYYYIFPTPTGAAPFTFIIANNSSAPVTNVSVVTNFGGGFSKSSDSCLGSLQIGQNCHFTISYSSNTASSSLISVLYNNGQTLYIQVSGPGSGGGGGVVIDPGQYYPAAVEMGGVVFTPKPVIGYATPTPTPVPTTPNPYKLGTQSLPYYSNVSCGNATFKDDCSYTTPLATLQGSKCYAGQPPAWAGNTAGVRPGQFVYNPRNYAPVCDPGHSLSAGYCVYSPTYGDGISVSNNKYYYLPRNRTVPTIKAGYCPSGIKFYDGVNCYIGSPPGKSGYLSGWNSKFAYAPYNDVNHPCNPGDLFDGNAHECIWSFVPAGWTPFVIGGQYYLVPKARWCSEQ